MKNRILLEVKGRNIERFLKRLRIQEIELLRITYLEDGIQILVYESDYEKILKCKSIYEITYLDCFGSSKIKKKWKEKRVFICFLFFCFLLLFFFSHVMMEIEIVHTDKNLRILLEKELSNYGVSSFSWKKSFSELKKIKEQILETHKDTIEWLEIETVGTKYVIRVEERKLEPEKEETKPRHIVAKKSAILKKIDAKNGEVMHQINDYVKEGEIVISGELKLYDEVKNITSAEGKIYGEVWYHVTVEYPLSYKEERFTGKKKTVYGITFLNSFFSYDFHPYQKEEKEVLWKSYLLPLSFVKKEEKECEIIDEVYTEEEAIEKAMEHGKKELEQKLKEGEKILSQKNLKVTLKESKIEVEMFFSVLEDITDFEEIKEGEKDVQENRN